MAPRPDRQRALVDSLAVLLSAEEAQIRLLSRLGAEAEDDALRAAVERHTFETHRHVGRVSGALKALENAEETRPVPELERIVAGHDSAVKERSTGVDGLTAGALARVERLELTLYERALDRARDAGEADIEAALRTSIADERRMLAEVERLLPAGVAERPGAGPAGTV